MSEAIAIEFVEGPLGKAKPGPVLAGNGARVVFEGYVRELEGHERIAALVYEAYRPMAEQVLAAIARHCVTQHHVHGVTVEHSVGRVEVGGCSFRLTIDAPHRKEALAAADEFIDRMKQDAPIWKSVVGGR